MSRESPESLSCTPSRPFNTTDRTYDPRGLADMRAIYATIEEAERCGGTALHNLARDRSQPPSLLEQLATHEDPWVAHTAIGSRTIQSMIALAERFYTLQMKLQQVTNSLQGVLVAVYGHDDPLVQETASLARTLDPDHHRLSLGRFREIIARLDATLTEQSPSRETFAFA